jgi:protein SCO1/2
MRAHSLTLWLVAALGLTVALVVGGFTLMDGGPQSRHAGLGGPFTLTDDLGRKVTEASLLGKPSVIYFGYTFCPEICPTTLLDLSGWMQKLGPAADRAHYVFVTVDPERDTVKAMHDYVGSFDGRIRGFTGTKAQIAAIAKEYGVYYAKEKGGGANYAVDHSTRIYLMDAKGRFVDTIAYQEQEASALAKLRRLVGS